MFGVAIASSSPAVAARCAYARAGRRGGRQPERHRPAARRAAASTARGRGERGGDARDPQSTPARISSIASCSSSTAGRLGDPHRRQGARGIRRRARPERRLRRQPARHRKNPQDHGGRLRRLVRPARRPPDRRHARGRDAGGEAGPVHSAGLKLVRDVPWPVADLRVDWTDACPIEALADALGALRAAARSLRPARPRPPRGAELRRAGRRVGRPPPPRGGAGVGET